MKATLRILLACGAVLSAVSSHAVEPDYPRDIAQWEEIPVPAEVGNPERVVWNSAANYSKLAWRVYLDQGSPSAELVDDALPAQSARPPFDAKADKFSGANRFATVDDGWLVGFNHGEFGAALYWFSPDGKRHYGVSNDQVVAFFSRPEGVYAIEGLAHMGMSCGSLIMISRPAATARWQARRVVQLPYAPETAALKRDGSMLIALSESLVSVSANREIKTLIAAAPWAAGLYPTSSILTPNEERLYIGMRQFVAEVDLTTNKLRLLLPSRAFLNNLPKDDERRLRAQYPEGMGKWEQPARICEKRR